MSTDGKANIAWLYGMIRLSVGLALALAEELVGEAGLSAAKKQRPRNKNIG